MKLTPLDIRKQEFKKSFRGFDPIEVQTFLDMVAEEYEQVLEDNKKLNRRMVELETKLKDFQETEKNLRETLLNVQEVKKQSEESSRRQADLIIKESELKALEIIEAARKQARKMRDEVDVLRTQKESFINRLRQILISQIELLSVLEIDDAIPEEAQQFLESARSRKKKALKSDVDRSHLNAEHGSTEGHSESDEIYFDEEDKPGTSEVPSGKGTPTSSSNVNAPAEKETKDHNEQESKDEKQTENREEDDKINEYFKKGIQIDELIKNLDKKNQE